MARPETFHLFVYGTLMSDHHVSLLINRTPESESAILYNYMKVVPPGAFYFVVEQHGSMTHGRILKNLTRDEIAKIDSFEDEGKLYIRKNVIAVASGRKIRCMTYLGNVSALAKLFAEDIKFEDRYSKFIEKKIEGVISKIEPSRHKIMRRVATELMGAEFDSIIESHFYGDYICNYIMIQAFEQVPKPPSLEELLANPDIAPYAGNYMELVCRHIVFNQIAEHARHQFPEAVRVSRKYFRHGLSVLFAFMYFNRKKYIIKQLFREYELDRIIPGKRYRDYAAEAISLVDEIYRREEMQEIVSYVEQYWYSAPTPLGAELEFSFLGSRAVEASPGEDKYFDGFYWFGDFDMYRRTWKLGGHVDSHRDISRLQRTRGFFEYALGRYQIVGDLSRPLFDCPWGMSLLINEAVKFLEIPPHSLHISMELGGAHSQITDKPHVDEDLICLLLLGGDIRPDRKGILREHRIFNNELDTNAKGALNFSDRKYHFSRKTEDDKERSEVMEYKFFRLHPEEFDYETSIIAMKGYQFWTDARPLSIPREGAKELPEQKFLKEWANAPSSVTDYAIESFIEKIRNGLLEEQNTHSLDKRRTMVLEKISERLYSKNRYIRGYKK